MTLIGQVQLVSENKSLGVYVTHNDDTEAVTPVVHIMRINSGAVYTCLLETCVAISVTVYYVIARCLLFVYD